MDQKLEAIIESGDVELYDEKYIVVEVHEDKCVKKVLVSFPMEYHNEIARAYQRKIGDKEMDIAGGGIIAVDKKAKKVRTYGQSGSYGKPDSSIVEKILTQAFPMHTIDAKVTEYVRG